MLSRVADNLYWMSRYMERAENTARMLDVQHQSSMLAGGPDQARAQWRALLRRSELEGPYATRTDEVTAERVLFFMVADAENSSSIVSCLSAARENARAVRVALASEMWESVNASWLEFRSMVKSPTWLRDPSKIFEWVKAHSHHFRGVMIGTMLRDEAYYFSRIGTLVERADNTARILDVRYVADDLRLSQSSLLGSADYYFWASVLRSVSAFEIYRKVYRDVITPIRISELLIQRAEMPRSLLACMNEVLTNLSKVANEHESEAVRRAGLLQAGLKYLVVDEAFEPKIHDFLSQFLRDVNQLGAQISEEFLVPLAG